MKDFYKTALKVAAGTVIVGALAAGAFVLSRRYEPELGDYLAGYMTTQYKTAKSIVKDPVGTHTKVLKDYQGVQQVLHGERPQKEENDQ